MSVLIQNGRVWYNGELVDMDLFIADNGELIVADKIDVEASRNIEAANTIVIPSLINPFSQDLDFKKMTDSQIKGGYGGAFVANSDNKRNFEDINFENRVKCIAIVDDLLYIIKGNSFAYRSSSVDETVKSTLKEHDALLIYTGNDYHQFRDTDLSVYLGDVKKDSLELIKSLKDSSEYIAAGISIDSLLEDDDYLSYIKAGVIDMVEVNEESLFADSFGLLYSRFVKSRKLELKELIGLMSYNPADYLGVQGGEIRAFEPVNLAVFDLHTNDRISEGKHKGLYSQAKCIALVVDGDVVYED